MKEYPNKTSPSIHPSVCPVSMCFQPLYFLQMYKISFYCQLNTKCVILKKQNKKKLKNSVLIVLHWLNVTTKLFLIFSGYFLHIYFAVVPNNYKFRKISRKINIENEKTVLGLTLHLSCSLSVCFQCASDNQYYLLYHYLMITIIMINMIINKYFFLQQTAFIVF